MCRFIKCSFSLYLRALTFLCLGYCLIACETPEEKTKEQPPQVETKDQPPQVVKPLENIFFDSTDREIGINLEGVFDDKDNENSAITFSATTSNSSLVDISIVDLTLILKVKPQVFGVSDVTVTAVSNGRAVDNSFNITVIDNTPGKAKIFLMAGQSNMVGHGRIDELSAIDLSLNNPRDDVFIASIIRPNKNLDKLQPGYGYHNEKFGVELQFGHVMGDSFKAPVYLFKAAKGGTTIEELDDWRPPQYGGYSGNLYEQMITGFKQFIKTELENKNIEYEVAGFIWFQGFNDAAQSFHNTYEKNLRHFIGAVRDDLGLSQLPVVITQINDTLKAKGQVVQQAQSVIANENVLNALVITDDQRPYYHYGSRSYVTIGDRIAYKMLRLLKGPVAQHDTYTTAPQQLLTVADQFGVLSNDSDTSLQAQLVTNVSHGVLKLNTDGSFSYQPEGGFIGQDSFQYRTVSTSQLSNIATVLLDVRHQNDSLSVYFDFDQDNAFKDKASGILARVKQDGINIVPEGRRGKAAHFNGKGVLHYIEDYPIKNYLNLSTDRDFSISVWVKSDAIQTQEQILLSNKWHYNRYPGWSLTTGGSAATIKAYVGSYNHKNYTDSIAKLRSSESGGLDDNNWHHVALTADFTRLRVSLYFDGLLVNEVDASQLSGEINRNESAIGNGSGGGDKNSHGFIGSIDEVKIYNRVLSAAEIQGMN